MAKETKPEEAEASGPLKSFTIKKDYVIGGKQYKKGDPFSHENQDVIDFLTNNKII